MYVCIAGLLLAQCMYVYVVGIMLAQSVWLVCTKGEHVHQAVSQKATLFWQHVTTGFLPSSVL